MNRLILAVISVIILLGISTIASANGFGEYSGFLIYNISINSSHTEAWTLLNSYNYSIGFYIVPPNLTINSSNVTPDLTFSTLNGTIARDSTYQVNVTVFIPVGATANTFWQGYATAFATVPSNQSNASAKIEIGTAKLIQITAEPQVIKKKKVTTTIANSTTPTNNQSTQASSASAPSGTVGVSYTDIILGVIIVALVAAVAYMAGNRKTPPAKQGKR
jgi:hypothetical protein